MINRDLKMWHYMLLTIMVTNCLSAYGSDQADKRKFIHKTISDGLVNHEIEVSLFRDNELVGFVHYNKIPLLATYVIHTLYVYPQYRNKGYGSELLTYIFNHLKKNEAKTVYIQPGAFEFEYKDPADIRKLKTKKLVEFYKKFGFKFVDPVTSKLAVVLYKMLRIDENSQYLMIKDLRRSYSY